MRTSGQPDGSWPRRLLDSWPKPRMMRAGAILCLLLLCLTSYDAIHVHRLVGPLENAPLTAHHCLLCLAAHLPLTINAGPVVATIAIARPAAPVPEQLGSYESATAFPLYTRPPPLA